MRPRSGVLAAAGLAGQAACSCAGDHDLILLPLVVPYIVLAVGLVILLHQLGITTSLTAVLAGHIVISLPYSVLVILPRLRLLDASINEAARDLGASELVGVRADHVAAAGAGAGVVAS